MPKKTILSDPSFVAKLPKYGHNLSHSFTYTSSTGMILPVLYDFLSPGDKIEVACDLFTRTQPMVRPAMVDIEQFVDFFFVPATKFNQLWKQLVTNVNDLETTAFSNVRDDFGGQLMPHVDFDDCPELYDAFSEPGESGTQLYNQVYFTNLGEGMVRLFDMLDLNASQFAYWLKQFDDQSNFRPGIAQSPPTFNPVMLAAYQSIYMDYYRLTDYEQNDPGSYNFDDGLNLSYLDNGDVLGFTGFSSNIGSHVNLWQLRYAPYRRDYFRNVKKSPLLAAGESLVVNLFNNIQSKSYINNPNTSQLLDKSSSQDTNPTSVGLKPSQPQATGLYEFNLANLRSMLATEKMMQIQGRARAHYDEQILAHFGFKTPKGISDEVYYLGGHSQQIELQDVVATASNVEAEEPLGALAGRGLSRRRSKDIKFTAPCHGVLMAVQYTIPKPRYLVGLSKLNTWFTQYDIPQPELDKLGMQPFYNYEYTFNPVQNHWRSGWQYRYQEYKLKPNRSTHAFANIRRTGDVQGSFRAWMNSSELYKQVANQQSPLSVSDLLCPPTALNDIMDKQFETQLNPAELFIEPAGTFTANWPTRLYAGDPFINDIRFKYFKVSFMSTFGLPDVGEV